MDKKHQKVNLLYNLNIEGLKPSLRNILGYFTNCVVDNEHGIKLNNSQVKELLEYINSLNGEINELTADLTGEDL